MTAPDSPGTPDGRSGLRAYEAWAAVLATNGVECEPFEKLGNVEQMAWREVEAIAVPVVTPAPGQSAVLLDAAIWRAITESRDCQGARIPCRHCKRSATELRAVIDAHVAAAAPQVAPAIRAELEALAAFWVREYVTDDGWPQVCAKQLLDVLAGTEAAAHAAIAAAAPAPPFGGEVHVDWHMTTGEWRQLYTDLWQHTDTPYIARLIGAGKIPAPPAGMQAAPAPAGDYRSPFIALSRSVEAITDRDTASRLISQALGAAEQPQAAPELAAAMTETRQLRDWLDDFTRAVIDLDAGRNGNFARAAHSVRKKAALAPVEGK